MTPSARGQPVRSAQSFSLEELARMLSLSTRDGLAILNAQGQLVDWNPSARAITGWDRQAAAARDIGAIPEGVSEIREGKWIDVRYLSLPAGDVVYRAILFSDCTAQLELREANRKLEEIGLTDPVTRLPKTALAVDHIARSISLGTREARPVGVLSVAVRLAATGDEPVLLDAPTVREIAVRLVKTVRTSDLVACTGPGAFVVALTQMRDVEDGAIVAVRLLLALGQPFLVFGGRETSVTAAIGVASAPRDGVSAEEILRKAQTAMSQADPDGGYRVFGQRRP